jgi:hypothetical protein
MQPHLLAKNKYKCAIMLAICNFMRNESFRKCQLGQEWYQFIDKLFEIATTATTKELAEPILQRCQHARQTQKKMSGGASFWFLSVETVAKEQLVKEPSVSAGGRRFTL